jgi:uncharacterized protein (TIGR02466 family)
MQDLKYDHHPLFSIPLYIADLTGPTEDELTYINSLTYRLNYGGGNVTSEDDNVLDKLPSLKDQVQHHLNNYVKDIINPETEFSFYVTQSWVNKNKKGTRHTQHLHTNSILSGVYYLSDDPEEISFFKFFDFLEMFSIRPKDYTPYNYNQFTFKPSKNKLILFPSILRHSVRETKDKERMSLAFNTFFKGAFGVRSDMSYLELK